MKTVTRLCLCGMLMFSFFAVTGCGDAKKDATPAAASGTDTAGSDTKTDGDEAK